ncbi:hypothetical protein C5167_018451 [Papaver somniferum]|uniref:Uncharacterized protein n=1 Tax=Papaver somniferum TaxID=3469 RepID=A0A4Y7IRG8_PAPSO|nr:hypothetical protein C5167_018451 [Papaver somniferum]
MNQGGWRERAVFSPY